MAEKDRKNSRTTTKSVSRRWRIMLAALATVMLIAAGVVSVWLISCFLFTHNKHFQMRTVKVSSSGWWNNRSSNVQSLLDLASDDVNLFKLDLRDLRQRLEDHPSIKRAEVQRLLPDTLAINIIERIPRAYLNGNNSRWVVDDTGQVMDREVCIPLDNSVPVILGIGTKTKLSPGINLPELLPVINLIMMTKTEFGDMRINTVSVNNPKQLTIILYYRELPKRYYVYMPTSRINTNGDIREMFYRLRSCINDALRTGDKRNVIYLGYSGQAVMR